MFCELTLLLTWLVSSCLISIILVKPYQSTFGTHTMHRFRFNENDVASKRSGIGVMQYYQPLINSISTFYWSDHRDAVMDLSQHQLPFTQRVPGALSAARNHLVPLQILLHIAQRVLVHPKPPNEIVAIFFTQITYLDFSPWKHPQNPQIPQRVILITELSVIYVFWTTWYLIMTSTSPLSIPKKAYEILDICPNWVYHTYLLP